MDSRRYKEFLLSNIPSAKEASGGREVVCRCFSCPDSKDPTKGHLYISIPQNESEPSFFDCKKCGYHGMVTYQKLLEWSLFDSDMALELANHNKKAMTNPAYYHKYNQNIYNISNSFITQDELSEKKLIYINNRLGLNFNYQDLLDNKIVLNLKDLLKANNITALTRHQNIVEQLDTSFIGFISFDNAFINLRNLAPEGKVYKTIDKRYINYSLFDKLDNTCKFYVIPCQVDIANPIPIKLHIAEGPFDILSIKYNLRKDNNQSVYVAATGKGYKGVLRYFMATLKLMNLEIHLYADSDVERWEVVDLANFLSVFKYPFYLHRNTIGKDMGVKPELIRESIERLV